jgi:hypothetical protein
MSPFGASVVDASPIALLVVAAEAVCFRRLRQGGRRRSERPCFGEIRDAMMRRRVVPRMGAPVRGEREERAGQNKAERRQRFERRVHFDLLSGITSCGGK